MSDTMKRKAATVILVVAVALISYVFAKAQQPTSSPAPVTVVRVNDADTARVNDLLKQIADLQTQIAIAVMHAKAVAVDKREASLAELDSAQLERDEKGLAWKFVRAQAKVSPSPK